MTTEIAVVGSMAGEPKRPAFAETVKSTLRNWRQTSGRASRREYWSFAIFTLVAPITLAVIGMVAAGIASTVSPDAASAVVGIGVVLAYALFLLLQVPQLTAAVRRLHDGGHSGWAYLIALIPYVGAFILLYFLAQGSQDGDNEHGPHPYRPGITSSVVIVAGQPVGPSSQAGPGMVCGQCNKPLSPVWRGHCKHCGTSYTAAAPVARA